MEIKEIFDQEMKREICDFILRKLPEWFGIESSIVEYTNESGGLLFYAAFDEDAPVGFLAVKIHNSFTAEACVMGVLCGYHRKKAGTALINKAVERCREEGFRYLTVKTLDGSAVCEPYERTRKFYDKMGFIPLEVFPLLWDKDNPCLFLVKPIS